MQRREGGREMKQFSKSQVSYDEAVEIARAMVADAACPLPTVSEGGEPGVMNVHFFVKVRMVSEDKAQ